jgi:hypothetical protein
MDRRMMNQWLAAQSQKKQLSEADMQRKRLGIVPNAEVRNKGGESATRASTPINKINEGKVGSDKEKMEDPSGVPSSMDTALTDRATMRGQAGEGGGTTRPNIYNPKINAEDAEHFYLATKLPIILERKKKYDTLSFYIYDKISTVTREYIVQYKWLNKKEVKKPLFLYFFLCLYFSFSN